MLVRIRDVKSDDILNTFRLFLDRSVRSSAKNKGTIAFEEHELWFKERMLLGNFFILESEAKKFVGQVRIDNKGNENVISVELVDKYRSKGIGSYAIKVCSQKVNKPVVAYIAPNNTPSIKAFEKAGYKRFIGQPGGGGHLKYLFLNNVFVIAEMSANHCGNIDLAKQIILAAKECGADAVKLQTYTADTMTIDCKDDCFKISGTLWDKKYLYDLYKEAQTPWNWQKELKKYADDVGIELFSTPFDNTSVDFLETIGVNRYKIASFEAIDINFVKYTASKQKPMIISVGISSEEEMQEAIDTCKSVGNNDITLLKCTSAYPAQLEDMNLLTIPDMIKKFGPQGVKIGLSDHSMNIETAVAAVALGARVIEKHFTLDRALGGADAAFSLNLGEFKATVDAIRNTEKALGSVDYSVNEKNRKFAKSLFVCEDIQRGEPLTPQNIRSIRPANGLHPRYYDIVIGKIANKDLKRGTPLKLEDIND